MKRAKLLSLLLCIIIVLAMIFSACDDKPVETPPQGPTETATQKPTETGTQEPEVPDEPEDEELRNLEMTVLAYYGDPTEHVAKKFAFQEYIEETYGFRFRVHSPARDTYIETINLQAVSGDLTGLVCLFTGYEMISWAQEGIILSLTDFLKDNDTWNDIVPESWREIYTWDGDVWGIPRGDDGEPSYFIRTMRGDWLENVGMSKPSNVEEFYEVSKAFTIGDPNKSGAADTWGFTSRYTWLMQDIFQAFDARTNHVADVVPIWNPNKDLWEDSVVKPEMAEACTYLRKCYVEGLVHPELFTMSANDVRNLVSNGYAGSCFYWDTWLIAWENNVKIHTPTAYMVGIGALTGNIDKNLNSVGIGIGAPYVLMANTEQPKQAINWAVDLLWGSAESHYAMRWGIMQSSKNGKDGFFIDGKTVYLLSYQLNPETGTVAGEGVPSITLGHPGYALDVGYFGYQRAYNSGDATWDVEQASLAAANLRRRYDVLNEYDDGRLFFLPEDLAQPDNEAFQQVYGEWHGAGLKLITDMMVDGVSYESALKVYLSTIMAFQPQETLDYANGKLGKASEQNYAEIWSSMN